LLHAKKYYVKRPAGSAGRFVTSANIGSPASFE